MWHSICACGYRLLNFRSARCTYGPSLTRDSLPHIETNPCPNGHWHCLCKQILHFAMYWRNSVSKWRVGSNNRPALSVPIFVCYSVLFYPHRMPPSPLGCRTVAPGIVAPNTRTVTSLQPTVLKHAWTILSMFFFYVCILAWFGFLLSVLVFVTFCPVLNKGDNIRSPSYSRYSSFLVAGITLINTHT